MPDPEDDLARYARSGCEAAFQRVVEHYGGLVLNSARRRIRDAGLAEELSQNVFALLARKAGKVSGYRSVSAWLYETTRLEAAKLLRGQARHRRRVEALTHESQVVAMTDKDDSDLQNLLPYLEKALDSLKAAERKILLSRFFDGQSFREIATSTGKSESACKMSLSRALEKLRQKLQTRGINVTVVLLGTFLQTEWARAAPVNSLSAISGQVAKASPGGAFSKTVMMNTSYKILQIGLAALLVGVCWKMVVHQDSSPAPEVGSKTEVTRSSDVRKTVDLSSSSQARLSPDAKSEPVPHEVRDLPNFYLPSISLKNTNLAEAMDATIAQYRVVCRDAGELPLPVVWELEGEAQAIENLTLVNGDLMSNSRMIGLLSGVTLEVEGNRFVFKEIKDGPRQSRQWTVPPNFDNYVQNILSDYVGMPPIVLETLDSKDLFLPDDLPSGTGKLRIASLTIEEIFRSAGFLEEGETLRLMAGSGRLISEVGPRSAAMIDAEVKRSFEHTLTLIRISPKKILNGESEELRSAIFLPGLTGTTIETGKEYIDRELQNGAPVVARVGVRLKLEPELYGFGERTKVTYSYIKEPTEEDLAVFQETGRLDDLNLEEFRVEEKVVIRPAEDRHNNLAKEFFGSDSEGNQLGLSIFSERVDASGRSLEIRGKSAQDRTQ